jgi:hypothetical protein
VPAGRDDLVETAVSAVLDGASARLWLAAWRAALLCSVEGFSVKTVRAALAKFGPFGGG